MFTPTPAATPPSPDREVVAGRTRLRALVGRTVLSGVRHGSLTVHHATGTRTYGAGPTTGPAASMTVHDERMWPALVRHGSTGMADAYSRGWFDTDDLVALLRLAFHNLRPVNRRLDVLARVLEPVRDRLFSRSRGVDADRANVGAHYDLSNRFFSRMLDPTMAYSCARWTDADGARAVDLHDAQVAKFERLAELLDLEPGHRVLELGTGWGGLAVHLAERHHVAVTTTTISREQYDVAEKRVAESGLDGRVTVLDQDYRDLDGTYDRIVSVEMIEAVDHRDHAAYFDTIARRLRPGGRAVLQAIVIDGHSHARAKYQQDFIKQLIFPGGCLPSIDSIRTAAARTGVLATTAVDTFGLDYPPTLAAWWDNVTQHRDEIADLGFDEPFLRVWQMYLDYCRAGFLEGHVDVAHVVLERRP